MSTASRMGFVFSPDAYWWPLLPSAPSLERDMTISMGTPDDGVDWEFTVVERMLTPNPSPLLGAVRERSVLGLQVCVFDDSWDAYAAIPEFFTELAKMTTELRRAGRLDQRSGRLEDVRDLCLRLGYVDDTPREYPGAGRG